VSPSMKALIQHPPGQGTSSASLLVGIAGHLWPTQGRFCSRWVLEPRSATTHIAGQLLEQRRGPVGCPAIRSGRFNALESGSCREDRRIAMRPESLRRPKFNQCAPCWASIDVGSLCKAPSCTNSVAVCLRVLK